MEFPLDEKQYEILNQVGQSNGSKVFQARCIQNNQIVAVKQIDLNEYPLDLKSIKDETKDWLRCQHPNIAKFYGLFTVGDFVWMIIEYMSYGSLKDIIKFGYMRGFRDESLISTILSQVLNGLKYLHDNKIFHHDIRTSKILVNEEGVVKITEVGINTSLVTKGNKRGSTLSLFGEECYMAPEVLKNEKDYNQYSDIWSLGLVAMELGTGKMPYAGMKFMESLVRIIDNDPPNLPESCNFSQAYRNFVKVCLVKDFSKRANSKELLSTKFIKSAKGPELVLRSLISSLSDLPEIFSKLHSNIVDELSNPQMSIVYTNDDSPPVQKVGRFKVTRTELAKPQSDQNNSEREVEKLANELMELTAEMEELQNENNCLKEKVNEIGVILENLKQKKGIQ